MFYLWTKTQEFCIVSCLFSGVHEMAKSSESSWTNTAAVVGGFLIAAVKLAEHFFKEEETKK